MFDTSCQNTTLPLHHKQEKRVIMMAFIISAGIVLAKVTAVGLMLVACGAIYIIESSSSADNAL